MQCVGPWISDKHFYLAKYIRATRQVRAKYLPPEGPGGAAFIDLFSGPGRARIKDPREFVDGSPLLAMKNADAPFSRVVLCDIDAENVGALRRRVAQCGNRCTIVEGDCNAKIDEILSHVPRYGLNVALIDPFGAAALDFETIKKLAAFERMDLIIHFPMHDFKRNSLKEDKKHFERFLGLPESEWGVTVTKGSDVPQLLGVFRRQLGSLNYPPRALRSPAVTNTMNNVLYNLVYASKNPKGDAIWQSITKTSPSGQTSWC